MNAYIRTYRHTYIHTYVHTYIPTHTDMQAYIYMHTQLRMHIHAYTHARIHTYMHIHTHMNENISIYRILIYPNPSERFGPRSAAEGGGLAFHGRLSCKSLLYEESIAVFITLQRATMWV